jgi:hypothetical protein
VVLTTSTALTKRTTPAPAPGDGQTSTGRLPILDKNEPIESSAGRLVAVISVAVVVGSLYTLSLQSL